MIKSDLECTDNPSVKRPLSRAAYLQQKRQKTRSSIISSAKIVFSNSNYFDAKIEDIINVARISRATFYSHFSSKRELATAIYEEIVPHTVALFARFPASIIGGEIDLFAWFRDFVDHYVTHCYATPLIAQMQLFEPEFRERILQDAERLIDLIVSHNVPGFSDVRVKDQSGVASRVRARLLMNQVATVCAEVAKGEISESEVEIYFQTLAANLLSFVGAKQHKIDTRL